MTSFWGELKRRNVVRVAVAYAIVSWLLLQVADVVLDNIEAPTWVFQAILLLLVIGFPVAIIFAWAFELTPEGLKKEKDVDRSESITHITGRKLDFVIIGVLVVAVGVLFAANTLIKIPPIVSQTSKSDDDITLRRFTIDLPKSMQFTAQFTTHGGYRPVIVSPDGRRVIFHGVIERRPQIYSRSFDSLNVLPVKGTENAGEVLDVSPDGQWIAYVDREDQMLKKVPVAGGIPVPLCELGGFVLDNITWGANNSIVFTSSAYNGLMQVSSSGGPPEPITFPENGEVHKQPNFLPDGKTLFFTIGERGTTPRQSDRIAVLSLESGEQKVLMAAASPQATSSGHLVYYKDKALWTVAFDADRLEITSESVAVVDDVQYTNIAHYSISDDGWLVYVRDSTFVDRSLVWVDRFGDEEIISIEPRPFAYPSVSPSGDRITVIVDDKNDPELWLYSLSRGTSTRMTFDESREIAPTWDQDGRYLYFSSNRVDDLFRADTSRPGVIEQLTDTSTHQYTNSITPDGRQLIFQELAGVTRLDLAILTLSDPPTTAFLLQTEFNESQGRISPDGRWLAYTSDQSGQLEVYVRPYPDVDSAVWQVSHGGGRDSVWAKNGKEIFFVGPTDMMVVAIKTDPNFEPGLPEPLFSHQEKYRFSSGISNYDVDPAGGRFLIVKKSSGESTLTDRIVVVQNWLDEVTQKIGAN